MLTRWLQPKADRQQLILLAPVAGDAIPLSETPDEAFAQGRIGCGLAIRPIEGTLVAPVDGTVLHVIQTAHAILLEQKIGLRILMHIGINTVGLQGRGFTPLVSAGASVTAGQELIRFDLNLLRHEGYSPITPIVIANEERIAKLDCRYGAVSAGEPGLMNVTLIGSTTG